MATQSERPISVIMFNLDENYAMINKKKKKQVNFKTYSLFHNLVFSLFIFHLQAEFYRLTLKINKLT